MLILEVDPYDRLTDCHVSMIMLSVSVPLWLWVWVSLSYSISITISMNMAFDLHLVFDKLICL